MEEDAQSFVAGCLGGIGGVIASHPFDTIRIRIQSRSAQKSGNSAAVAREIFGKEKVRGIFKGMTHPLLGQAAINAIVFGLEDNVKRRLFKGVDDSSLSNRAMANGVSGMIAGGVQTVVVCPMELMKIRMQKQGEGRQHVSWTMKKMHIGASTGPVLEHYQGPWEKTKQVLREQGVRKGLYRGWWFSIFREVPQFGIYFSSFTFLKAKMAEVRHKSEGDLNVLELSLAGGVTGVATWLWYPFDVVKTLYQADGAPGKPVKYKGMWDCIAQSYKRGGWRFFWRGFGPTAVRGFVNSAATFPIVTLYMASFRPGERHL